jgi:hypothetical protein
MQAMLTADEGSLERAACSSSRAATAARPAASRPCSSTSRPRRPSRWPAARLQIHGGVGYTKEYGAEKLLRDALVMPIYEGTSQIQSLMAMKDAMSAPS